MEYTYDAYISLINKVVDKGYTPIRFKDLNKDSINTAILRHDVDLDLDKAAVMAELERENDIASTFFVLISSEYYNLFSKNNIRRCKEIMSMGHEIGLHFDVSRYNEDDDMLENNIIRELDLLSNMLGTNVESISWHIPKNELLGERLDFLHEKGIKNAYDPELFYNFKYFSDSMMRWREPICDMLDINKYQNIQILTHPIWYNEYVDAIGILNRNLAKKIKESSKYLATIVPSFSISGGVHDYNN